MQTRRVLAFSTAWCLLLSLFMLPRTTRLVCRYTGLPMTPVVAPEAAAAEKSTPSCCAVAVTLRPDGSVRAALTAPGCCDLRSGSPRTVAPALMNAAADFSVAVLAAAPFDAPLPRLADAALPHFAAAESAPRAPPIRRSSPRAPPTVS